MSCEVMIVAGEASGDLHGSRLVTAMLDKNPQLRFSGIGGRELAGVGVELLYDVSKISVVGAFEVFSYLPHIFKAQAALRRRMAQSRPGLLILIDFPDFNLLLARKAKHLRIPVFYYISPQVWAWRSGRVKTIGRLTDAVGVILPFEEQFYQDRGVDKAAYVGHPLLDTVSTSMSRERFCGEHGIDHTQTLIGIVPGSRSKEIDTLLPVFLSAAEKFQRQCREKPLFLLPRASTVNEQTLLDAGVALYRQEIDIHIVDEQRYDLMAACDAIIAASGTVTLEILLLETPMVVAYKVSPMSYRLGRVLVNIDYFCLVNLIAGKEIVRELLQDDANPGAIAAELHRLVFDESRQLEQLEGYREVRARLGKSGASAKAAALALSCLKSDG
jgi:lipid-A-disaccharide synthase